MDKIENESSQKPEKPLSGFEKVMWWVIVAFCGIWVITPPPIDPTDVVPVIGWIDEGLAIFIGLTALNKLGIHIPFLDKILGKRFGTSGAAAPEGPATQEKDVTPK